MSGYLDFLGESTDAVKSRKRLSSVLLVLVYIGIWAVSLIVFWCFTSGSDAMGYSLMFLWLLLPVTTFVISWLAGAGNHWGRWKWVSAVVFGVMYMLAEYATFSLANMVSFCKVDFPSVGMLFVGAIISAAGLSIGTLIRRRRCKWEGELR